MKAKLKLAPAVSDAAILAKATIRAAERLELTSRTLARIIGVSEATVSRMKNSDYAPEPDQKPFELAVMFVRLYRSLDAVVGGDDKVAGQWLRNGNSALNARPIELIQTLPGLVNVIQYLDARRAVI